MTSSVARCIFKCGGKDSRLCQEAKRNYLQLFKLVFTSQESGKKSGPTHKRVSRTGLGWGGHGQWLWEEPAESGRGGSKSLALTVKSGSGARNLWSLGCGLFPWGGLGGGSSPERWAQRETWLLAGHLGAAGGGQSQSQGATTSRVGGATKDFWNQETGVQGPHIWGAIGKPMAVGTKWLLAPHLMRPVTPNRHTGHRRPQGPKDRLRPDPEEWDIPAGCVSRGPPSTTPADAHPPERTRGSLRGMLWKVISQELLRIKIGSVADIVMPPTPNWKPWPWTHMLELTDPDLCPFSKYLCSSCSLPGSVLGI